jgi:hypothetical protein
VRKRWIAAGAAAGALALAVGIVTVATAGNGKGNGRSFGAELKGFSEVPAVSTAARGRISLQVNGSQIRYKLSYSGLEGPVRFAHIHFAQEDVNGGVAAFLCGGNGKPACPQSGEVTGTITASNVIGPAAQGIAAGEINELIVAIRKEKTYANVHSNKFPDGEIRGQIERNGDDDDDDDDHGRGDDDD